MARWTAAAGVAGIACGVAALIVATALANGFRDELRDKILRGTAHVTLSREGGLSAGEAAGAAARARRVGGVRDAAATTYEGALLSGPAGAAYALLRGLDATSPRALEEVRGTLTAGALDPLASAPRDASAAGRPGAGDDKAEGEEGGDEEAEPLPLILGEELAARTGLARVGDEGWVLTAEAGHGASEVEARSRRVRVAGLFRTGLYDYDSAWAYAPLTRVGRAAGAADPNTVVSVEARDAESSGEVARRLREALGAGWAALDWREANRPLFAALELERRAVGLIIMLVTVVAALNITTTLALVVVERRADIAVLATLGARAPSVTLVFVVEGALIGAAGSLAGVVVGLAACFVADRFRLVSLPPDVYSLSAVPLHPHAADVALAALAAFAVSLLATLYPAWQAARVRPAEVLRHE
ncbi:MAG TPA: FtsX-like permease family protein [Pyrinomonadaceae bacterium]